MAARILVIDDTKNIKLMIGKALQAEGYDVDCAANGYEGIELYKGNIYDLVLLDIRMPNLSGTEVLKILKDINMDIPVIIITAYPTVRNAVDCIKIGAVDYLRKPFTAEKIINIVKQVLDRSVMEPINTESYDMAMSYAKKCINKRQFDESIKYLKKAISLNLEEGEPFNILGYIYEVNKNMDKAYKYYSIAQQLDPKNEEILTNLNRLKKF